MKYALIRDGQIVEQREYTEAPACKYIDGKPMLRPIIEFDQPAYDGSTHKLEREVVILDESVEYRWNVVPLSPEEIRARIPSVVSMRQARLALLGAGLLSQVNDALAAMAGIEGEAARIEWEFAAEVKRSSPLVVSLSAALGLSEAQLDALFTQASTL